MESTAVPGTIQVAASTWAMCSDRYVFEPREVEVKGLGLQHTYLLRPSAPAAGSPSLADSTPRRCGSLRVEGGWR
jgi:hypothetical protein